MLNTAISTDQLSSGKPLVLSLKGERQDCVDLATRFDWVDVSSLTAEIKLKAIANQAYHASGKIEAAIIQRCRICLLYTSPSPRDLSTSRMPSSA